MKDRAPCEIKSDLAASPNPNHGIFITLDEVGSGATRLARVLKVSLPNHETVLPNQGYDVWSARAINRHFLKQAQLCPGTLDARCCGAQRRNSSVCGYADWRPHEDLEWYGQQIERACDLIDRGRADGDIDALILKATWLGMLLSELQIKVAWDVSVIRAESARQALAQAGRQSRKGMDENRIEAVDLFSERNPDMSKEAAYRFVASLEGSKPGTIKKAYLKHIKNEKAG